MYFRYISKSRTEKRRQAEAIARNFARTRPNLDMEFEREMSKKKADIARGKKPMELVDEPMESDGEEVEPQIVAKGPKPRKERANKDKARKLPTTEEICDILLGMNFVGTRYPHRETMKKLGIARDVDYLIENCGLATIMGYQFEGYRVETCHFLATLEAHLYDEDSDAGCGLGYLTFTVRRKRFVLEIRDFEKLFGFASGMGTHPDFEKTELQSLWGTIADGTFSSSRSKSSHIRSPVIRYFHKAVANTMFARIVTGNVNESELQLIGTSLKGILNTTRNGATLHGDCSETGLAVVLIEQLMSYKDWAIRLNRMGTKGELSIGGIITPILHACGVEMLSEEAPHRWMDIDYLLRTHFLDRKAINGMFLYQFTHPETGDARLILPNPPLTSIRAGKNIDFWPPREALFTPQSDIQEDQNSSGEEESDSERFHFSDQNTTLKEANKRIGLLQKWCKWQDKTIRSLKSTMKEMASSMTQMTRQMKELQVKISRTPSSPIIPKLSELRRSGSCSMAPRRVLIPQEPPRHSIQESKYYQRRRKMKEQEDHTSTPLEQSDRAHMQQDESGTEAASYTHESMDEGVSAFFSHP